MERKSRKAGGVWRNLVITLVGWLGLMAAMRWLRFGVREIAEWATLCGAPADVAKFFVGISSNLLCVALIAAYGTARGRRLRGLGGGYLKGAAISLGMIATIVMLTWLAGGVRVAGSGVGRFDAVEFVAVMVVAMSNIREEALYRWWMLDELKESIPTGWAVVVSSLLFGLAHCGNAHVTPFAVANLTLLGAFWALCYLRTGSFWIVAAMHTFWNFAQQRIFGLPMSGSAADEGIVRMECVGEGIFATDGFGLEGNLATTLVLAVAVTIVALGLRNKLPKQSK